MIIIILKNELRDSDIYMDNPKREVILIMSNIIHLRSTSLLSGILVAFAAFTIIFVAGCSKDNLLSPAPTDSEQNMLLYETLFNSSAGDSVEVVVTDSADITVNAGLGTTDTLSYSLEGLSNSVICDANAVSTPTDLQMHCERLRFVRGVDSTRAAILYNCGPDGTVFNDSLVIDTDPSYYNNNPASNVVKLYVYSDLQQRWLLYDTTQKANPRIVFYLTHFSKYAIAD